MQLILFYQLRISMLTENRSCNVKFTVTTTRSQDDRYRQISESVVIRLWIKLKWASQNFFPRPTFYKKTRVVVLSFILVSAVFKKFCCPNQHGTPNMPKALEVSYTDMLSAYIGNSNFFCSINNYLFMNKSVFNKKFKPHP